MTIHRSERILRTAILDVLCSQPPLDLGSRLRRALNESRDPGEHPEDRCEECRSQFEPWHAPTEDWARATGRAWGGPILCRPCFNKRLSAQSFTTAQPKELTLSEVLDGAERASQRVEKWPEWKRELGGGGDE